MCFLTAGIRPSQLQLSRPAYQAHPPKPWGMRTECASLRKVHQKYGYIKFLKMNDFAKRLPEGYIVRTKAVIL